MIDRFTAVSPKHTHCYQLHFHLNAPSTVADDGRVVTRGDGGNLLIVPVPGAAGTPELRPSPWPTKDYENPDWLTYTRETAGSWSFVTLLVPFTGTAPSVSVRQLDVAADDRILTSFEATALAITVDGREDIYVDQHQQWNLAWTTEGCRGEGRVFHSRV
jgi:hypothetical protein